MTLINKLTVAFAVVVACSHCSGPRVGENGPEALPAAVQQQPEPNREWRLQSNILERRGCVYRIQDTDRPYAVNHRVGEGECLTMHYELTLDQYSLVEISIWVVDVYDSVRIHPNYIGLSGATYRLTNETSGAESKFIVVQGFSTEDSNGTEDTSDNSEYFLDVGVYVLSVRVSHLARGDLHLWGNGPLSESAWTDYGLEITVTQ